MAREVLKKGLAAVLSLLMALSPLASTATVYADEGVDPIPATYTVSLVDPDHGVLTFRNEDPGVKDKAFEQGVDVTIDVATEDGYDLDKVSVIAQYDNKVLGEANESEGSITFAMPDENIRIEATVSAPEPEVTPEPEEKPETQQTEEAPKNNTATAQEAKPVSSENVTVPDITVDTNAIESTDLKADDRENETPSDGPRLIVQTDDVDLLENGHVIGSIGDTYLVQFGSEEEAEAAKSEYEQSAEYVAEDIKILATDEDFVLPDEASAEDIPMTEGQNPFVEFDNTDADEVRAENVVALIDTGVTEGSNVIDRYSV